eukprot:SAG11_NODE_12066_length_723_cov_1.250000_2_plen_47_part_01
MRYHLLPLRQVNGGLVQGNALWKSDGVGSDLSAVVDTSASSTLTAPG